MIDLAAQSYKFLRNSKWYKSQTKEKQEEIEDAISKTPVLDGVSQKAREVLIDVLETEMTTYQPAFFTPLLFIDEDGAGQITEQLLSKNLIFRYDQYCSSEIRIRFRGMLMQELGRDVTEDMLLLYQLTPLARKLIYDNLTKKEKEYIAESVYRAEIRNIQNSIDVENLMHETIPQSKADAEIPGDDKDSIFSYYHPDRLNIKH